MIGTRARRRERLEIATRTHSVFAETFACPCCGEDMTNVVRRFMTDGGRFWPEVIAHCRAGTYVEYRMDALV